ncbi:MAG: LCP family protein [Chloroherpetonaceae bacterium]
MKKSYTYILVLSIVLLSVIAYIYIHNNYSNAKSLSASTQDSIAKPKDEAVRDTNFYKAIFEDTSTENNGSNSIGSLPDIGVDNSAGFSSPEVANARRINIAVIGLDSRLGSNAGHADANHILSIMPDIGKIEIISIPRDTYVDCGYEDSLHLNKLTVFYLARGRQEYFKKICEISRLNKIDYYIEFGFSQAMAILRFLGYDSKETLQILRSRRGFSIGDYQRVYNQAQFMRQAVLKYFNTVNGPLRPAIINGSFALVRTNLNYSIASDLLNQLQQSNLTSNPNNISIKIRPSLKTDFKVFDFSDPNVLAKLDQKIAHISNYPNDSGPKIKNIDAYVYNKLNKAVLSAESDTAKNPTRAISKVETFYNQKAWHQIEDENNRNEIRDRIANILIVSYKKKNNPSKANAISSTIEQEKKLFEMKNISNTQ